MSAMEELKPAESTPDWLEKQMPLVRLEELKKQDGRHMMEDEPQRCQENPEESKRFAMEYIDASFAKLQEETKRFVMEYTDACFAKLQEETKKPAKPTPPPPGRDLSVNLGMDELRMKYLVYNPELFEEYREGYKRDAMEYMDACFAKLQETIRPGVEYELVSVPFIQIGTTSLRAECEGRYTHIHFKAKRQNASPHHQQSPEAFCAVILKNDDGNPVLGCNHLANYCDNYPSRIADQENCLWARDYEYPTLCL